MKRATLLLLTALSGAVFAQADITSPNTLGSVWSPATTAIGYGVRVQLDRFTDSGAPRDSVLTVGAQINAINRTGVHQIAFGIATEAWAEQGSFSRLVGIEATTINREPENWLRKIAFWSTFKNRPDTEYFTPVSDPANADSQGLRFESQPNTGFERAIVFAKESLHRSRVEPQPIVVDYKEVPMEVMREWILVRYPDGYCKYYMGQGREENRVCGSPPILIRTPRPW